jgi:hypothetical protein
MKVTLDIEVGLIEKLRVNKKEIGLSINKQANQAIKNYFKYYNKSHCKKF